MTRLQPRRSKKNTTGAITMASNLVLGLKLQTLSVLLAPTAKKHNSFSIFLPILKLFYFFFFVWRSIQKTDGIRCWLWWYLASIEYRHSKPSDQPPLEVPDVWGALRQRGPRFDWWYHTRNLARERDPI